MTKDFLIAVGLLIFGLFIVNLCEKYSGKYRAWSEESMIVGLAYGFGIVYSVLGALGIVIILILTVCKYFGIN